MDFYALYQQSQKELSELSQKKAVVQSQITELVEKLGLDKSKPIQPQVEALKKETEEKLAQMTSDLEKIVSELESIKTTGDESESFE